MDAEEKWHTYKQYRKVSGDHTTAQVQIENQNREEKNNLFAFAVHIHVHIACRLPLPILSAKVISPHSFSEKYFNFFGCFKA